MTLPGTLRALAAAVVTVGALLAVGWLSRVPVGAGPASEDDAVIRLAWRLRAESEATDCRRPTPEELAELPAHMRNPDACMGAGLAFHLAVSVDGREVVSDTLEPAGARGDRPVFVLREIPVPAGEHALAVTFRPLGDGAADAHTLQRSVRLEPRRVLLVTWDADAGRLVTKP